METGITRTPAIRRPNVLVSALAAVGWAYVGMAAVAATALALPLLAWLTGLSADASLSAFGVDAVGGGVELHGSAVWALALGAAWGAGTGAAGELLARTTGTAGSRAAPLARGAAVAGAEGAHAGLRTYPDAAYEPGPYRPAEGYRPPDAPPNPYAEEPADPGLPGAPARPPGEPHGSPGHRDP